MRKHEPTFSEIIKGRCSFACINLGDLEKKSRDSPHNDVETHERWGMDKGTDQANASLP